MMATRKHNGQQCFMANCNSACAILLLLLLLWTRNTARHRFERAYIEPMPLHRGCCSKHSHAMRCEPPCCILPTGNTHSHNSQLRWGAKINGVNRLHDIHHFYIVSTASSRRGRRRRGTTFHLRCHEIAFGNLESRPTTRQLFSSELSLL